MIFRRFFLLFLLIVSAACQRSRATKPVQEIFKPFHPEFIRERLTDWGKVHSSRSGYWQISPADVKEVQKIVRTAHEHDVPLRIRGRGHSMNGSTLPQSGELLVRTQNLRHFELFDRRTVIVGAAIPMYSLDYALRPLGCKLPITSDGDRMGPTVGGFISAGGIGAGAAKFGAFWENVQEVSLVDGRGDLVVIDREDPNFPWLFGSMGQLGIIVEAKLTMLCESDVELHLGSRSNFPVEPAAEHVGIESIWFTLFVPDEAYAQAKKQLDDLMLRHVDKLKVFPTYTYRLKLMSWLPPLIYPQSRNVTAVGMWGRPRPETTPKEILAVEAAFMDLVLANPTYRRYLQTEIVPKNFDYRKYFGDAIFEEFLAKKHAFDPKMIFDRGFVFR